MESKMRESEITAKPPSAPRPGKKASPLNLAALATWRFTLSPFRFQVSSLKFRRFGFTLIELLVVIAIIALLSGVMLPAIWTGIAKGKMSKARGEVHALARAVEAYQTEYTRYPGQDTGGSADHDYSTDYKELISTLRGTNTTGGAFSNPRTMIFLDVSDKSIATASTGGTAQPGDLADPWGNRYNVMADWNFDNKVEGADGQEVGGRGVAAWSWGNNNQTSPNKDEPSHIRSWK
jgi:prepilin-type N-terminal cleavage/methylation domain-containing protein